MNYKRLFANVYLLSGPECEAGGRAECGRSLHIPRVNVIKALLRPY